MKQIESIKGFVIRRKGLTSFILAAVAYFLFALFYMGGAITNCSESLLNFPGDNTAGMIALFSVDPSDPWYGHSNYFSFPYGESLGQPTHITAQAVFVPFWVLAKFFGPVCSFNLLQLFGFLSAALVMFGFIRWLLKGRELVALIAGFTVAFTPYLQITSGGHISYVFGAVFISAIWLFMLFWINPSWKKVVALAANIALFAYIDGYFILLGGVLMVALAIGAVGYDFWRAGKRVNAALRERLKLMLLAAGAIIVFMLPVVYVQLSAASQINSLLAESRDSIQREAQVYGARPLEYLTPNAMNPLTSGIFGTFAERDTHGSNTSESIISLSLTLLVLAGFFVASVVIAVRRKQPLNMGRLALSPTFITVVVGLVFALAVMFSFPPKLGPLTMPSYFLIEGISLWRVLARLFVIVNIAVVILGACGLALLAYRLKRHWQRVLLCLLVLVLVFLEYLTFVPPRMVNTYQQVPQMYHWLSDQEDYQTMVEYPLDELGESHYPVFYNTYQRVHGKKMLNGIVKEEKPYFARRALHNLDNPQTVPGLRALGIDFVTVHAPKYPGDIAGLKFVYKSSEAKLKTNGQPNYIWGYEVAKGPKADYLIATKEGFHAPIRKSATLEYQVMGHQGVLQVMKVNKAAKDNKTVPVVMKLRSLTKGNQEIKISQDGKEVWRGEIPKDLKTIEINVTPGQDLVITAVNPTTDATLELQQINTKQH